ncbi:hypothetical protein D3C83_322870 [compost metagenome]
MAIGVVGVLVALLCVWLFVKAVTFVVKAVFVLVAIAALAVGVGVLTGKIAVPPGIVDGRQVAVPTVP